jgi:hypothetical protein
MAADRRVTLAQIRIATPCDARWEDMQGDDSRRFCDQCGLHVHDLSAMTREAGEAFLAGVTGRACVRLYERADGRVLTSDCPVGLAKVRARARKAASVCVAAIACAISIASAIARKHHPSGRGQGDPNVRGVMPFSWVSKRLGVAGVSPTVMPMMGAMILPPEQSSDGAPGAAPGAGGAGDADAHEAGGAGGGA